MKRLSKSLPLAANIVLPLLICHYAGTALWRAHREQVKFGHPLGTDQIWIIRWGQVIRWDRSAIRSGTHAI